MARRRFVMTEAQHKAILEASKPTPVMYLSGGMSMFPSPQENANRAWQALGKELGFVWDTVEPCNDGEPRAFTAETVDVQS